MKTLKTVPMLALVLASIIVDAASPTWDSEPTSVMGIPLGQPIPHRLLDCPVPFSAGGVTPHEVCMVPNKYGAPDAPIQLMATPFSDLRLMTYLTIFDGKVSGVYFDIDHQDYEQFKRLLITRYGSPTESKIQHFSTVAGGSIASEYLKWDGKRVAIDCYEHLDKVNRSVVSIHDISLMNAAADVAAEREKQKAAQF